MHTIQSVVTGLSAHNTVSVVTRLSAHNTVSVVTGLSAHNPRTVLSAVNTVYTAVHRAHQTHRLLCTRTTGKNYMSSARFLSTHHCRAHATLQSYTACVSEQEAKVSVSSEHICTETSWAQETYSDNSVNCCLSLSYLDRNWSFVRNFFFL